MLAKYTWFTVDGAVTLSRIANNVPQMVNEDVVILSIMCHLMVRKSHARRYIVTVVTQCYVQENTRYKEL